MMTEPTKADAEEAITTVSTDMSEDSESGDGEGTLGVDVDDDGEDTPGDDDGVEAPPTGEDADVEPDPEVLGEAGEAA